MNVWAKGPFNTGMTCGWPHKWSTSPPSPLPPLSKKALERCSSILPNSVPCFCVTRTTGNPVYAQGASSLLTIPQLLHVLQVHLPQVLQDISWDHTWTLNRFFCVFLATVEIPIEDFLDLIVHNTFERTNNYYAGIVFRLWSYYRALGLTFDWSLRDSSHNINYEELRKKVVPAWQEELLTDPHEVAISREV